jgi:hypothetical protein
MNCMQFIDFQPISAPNGRMVSSGECQCQLGSLGFLRFRVVKSSNLYRPSLRKSTILSLSNGHLDADAKGTGADSCFAAKESGVPPVTLQHSNREIAGLANDP